MNDEHAKNKLANKNADMIVLNSLRDKNAGFGFDTNKVSVFFADGKKRKLSLQQKKKLLNKLFNLSFKK